MTDIPDPDDKPANALTFDPVPRKVLRHDGWTPERQRAFVEALADTGSVTQACRIVNMHPDHAYGLRRHPQGGSFRAAWDAALGLGVERLKGEAFDRALNGQLVPVFVGGKLTGYRRVRSDRLLMFCLRYYGGAAPRRETTVNYVTASADAGAGGGVPSYATAAARASTAVTAPLAAAAASVRSVTRRPSDGRVDVAGTVAAVASFTGVTLDAEARAAIRAALDGCATRQRGTMPQDDPALSYVDERDTPTGFAGTLEFGGDAAVEEPFIEGEASWTALGDDSAGDAEAALETRSASSFAEARRAEIEEDDERMVVDAAHRLATNEIASLPPMVTDLLTQGRGMRALERARGKSRKTDR